MFSDGARLHFAVTKLDLTYDGTWNAQQSAWTGKLTFQKVYPLVLKRATVADLAPAVHKRPQEATGGPNEYNDIEETMSPAALNLISGWIRNLSEQK